MCSSVSANDDIELSMYVHVVKQTVVGVVHGANSSSNEQLLVDENIIAIVKKFNKNDDTDNKAMVDTTATKFTEGNEELKYDQSLQTNESTIFKQHDSNHAINK